MYSKNKLEFNEEGYTVIDDFLPIHLAEKIFEIFDKEKEWEFKFQERLDHYKHVFKTNNHNLPHEDEVYSSKFSRSVVLERNEIIQEVFDNFFIPLLNRATPYDLKNFDIRCHKQDKGDYFRAHIDDYGGDVNLIYYVNKQWVWDWGGILNISSNDQPEFNKQIFPKFNRLVLLNNKFFRSPHFVSSVEQFAKIPRFSIVSFNK